MPLGLRRGVYPGSFDPLTVAHVAVVNAAIAQLDLDRLDLAISRSAFDKEHLDEAIEDRTIALRRSFQHRAEIGVVVSDHRLIAELASGYDVVVMGADKWHQLHELRFYDDDPERRDAALAALPRVAVAPRTGWTTPDEHRLHLAVEFADVSATEVRAGRHDWRASAEPG